MTPVELRISRNSLGWTQERLARALRVNPRTIRKYEGGQRPIPGLVDVAIWFLLRYGASGAEDQPSK